MLNAERIGVVGEMKVSQELKREWLPEFGELFQIGDDWRLRISNVNKGVGNSGLVTAVSPDKHG